MRVGDRFNSVEHLPPPAGRPAPGLDVRGARRSRKQLAIALASLVFLLAPVSGAAAHLRFGVADETGKYAADGGAAFFSSLRELGMADDRFTIRWDPSQPETIPDKAFLDRSVPVAAAFGIRIVFDVYLLQPQTITSSPDAGANFAHFLQLVARTYSPSVVIVGNEPNQPRFWQPQFDAGGAPVAGAAYEPFLAQAYDALKAVNPGIDVVAAGPSSRGNDNPNAPNNISASPVRFIHDLGVAYRASGRTRPLMDQLGFHPYPLSNTDPVTKNYEWPNAGIADLDRVKQAVWDAFHGTAQPTFAEPGEPAQSNPLTIMIDEVGWQVEIVPSSTSAYFGTENVPTVDESTQAQIYNDLVHLVPCDSVVTDLLLFQLIDDPDLSRFQSGLVRADGTVRPSYGSMRAAIAETKGECLGSSVIWQHTENVVNARGSACAPGIHPPAQRFWGYTVQADEDATYRAGIFRLEPGRSTAPIGLLDRSLPGRGGIAPVLSKTGEVDAYIGRLVVFPKQTLAPGRYVCAARLTAAMNPGRTSLVVSQPFTAGRAATLTAQPPKPVAGKSATVGGVRGMVRVKVAGSSRFVTLRRGGRIVLGSTVDATHGVVTLLTASSSRGGTQSGVFFGGQFVISQTKATLPITLLRLTGGSFGVCRARHPSAFLKRKPKPRPKIVRRLWGNAHGRYRTVGRYSSTAVRGTYWLTLDRCDGTLTHVRRGIVVVSDFSRHRVVRVRAGKSYLARRR